VGDFRPGRPLRDYRVHYGLLGDDAKMTVVGHVEQLRQSACYQKSSDLTCLTCHDPHRGAPSKDSVALQRQNCLKCHESKPCGLEVAKRLQQNAADNCVVCHMPQSATEVAHVAFTHHRIGLHKPTPASAPADDLEPKLVPLEDLSHLSAGDRERNLGLAYWSLLRTPELRRFATAFRNRARTHLEAALSAGVRDGSTMQTLAEFYNHADPELAAKYAQMALEVKAAPASSRVLAQLIRADVEFRKRDFIAAIPLLEDLTRQRRFAEDWRLLGVSHLEQGQTEKGVAALEKALAIRPSRPMTHLGLEEAYRRLGDQTHARDHQAKAQWLIKHGYD